MKTVPVVVYVDGVRKVIGEAEVEIGTHHITMTAVVHPDHASCIKQPLKHISLGPFQVPTPKE